MQENGWTIDISRRSPGPEDAGRLCAGQSLRSDTHGVPTLPWLLLSVRNSLLGQRRCTHDHGDVAATRLSWNGWIGLNASPCATGFPTRGDGSRTKTKKQPSQSGGHHRYTFIGREGTTCPSSGARAGAGTVCSRDRAGRSRWKDDPDAGTRRGVWHDQTHTKGGRSRNTQSQ
jgi:hypothetical protein